MSPKAFFVLDKILSISKHLKQWSNEYSAGHPSLHLVSFLYMLEKHILNPLTVFDRMLNRIDDYSQLNIALVKYD